MAEPITWNFPNEPSLKKPSPVEIEPEKEMVKKESVDWRNLFEVKTEPITCFRIIPDKTITNHSNYKFYKDIHELEKQALLKQVVENIKESKERKAVKLHYQPANDYVWYEILVRHNSINFYVLCYESNSEFVSLKLEQAFPNATIEVVEPEETEIPMKDTFIADLTLQRHSYFSIHTDYKEQNQPIEDILSAAEDVKEGDVIKFTVRAQPFDQNYWSYKSEEWHKKTLKGKAPKKVQITKAGALGTVNGITELAFQKLGQLFRELHTIAFNKRQTNTQIVVEHATQETREIGGISRQTIYKETAPVFKTVMRVASHSSDETRRLMNLKGVSNGFIDLKDTNNAIVRGIIYREPEPETFTAKGIFKRKEKEPENASRGIKEAIWKWVYDETSNHKVTPISLTGLGMNIMCDKELGKLMQMPTAGVQKKYEDKMEAKSRPEIGIPAVFRESTGVYIAEAVYKGESYAIKIPYKKRDEFILPIIVSGIQGSGKDTFAVNWVVENALQGRGAVIPDVIDEKGRGMSDAIIKCLPPEKLVILNFADPKYSPYLDWSEAVGDSDRFTQNRFSQELVKFFEVDDKEAGIQTERYLKEAAKALPHGTPLEIGMLFISSEYRQKVIDKAKARGDNSVAAFWERIYNGETEARQRQIASPVLNRLYKLTGDPTLKVIFGAKPNGAINFDKWLSEGKVIICKIPKTVFSTLAVRTLYHWILVKTWLTKQVQFNRGEVCDSILVMNEPHQVLDSGGVVESLKEMFPESRKFGLQLLTLFHDFSQIPKDLSDIMIQSGANFILLKQRSDKTWKKFEKRIESEYTMEDCEALEMHEAMVGFLIDKKDQPVIRVRMNDMPYSRGLETYENDNLATEHLEKYGRLVTEIEAEILEEEMILLGGQEKKKKSSAKKG